MLNIKNRLWISLGTGFILALSVWIYIRQAEKKIRSHYVMAPALVAKRYIPPGKIVSADGVQEIQIPQAYLEPTALQSVKQLQASDGHFYLKTKVGVLKGAQVSRSALVEENTLLGLSWALPPDLIAATVRLESHDAVGGFLQPGDWVSVLSILEPQPGWPVAKSFTLFGRVQVFAVQDQLYDPTSSGEKFSFKNVATESVLVTLGLSSKQAAALSLAKSRGQITLALISAMRTKSPSPASMTVHEMGEIN